MNDDFLHRLRKAPPPEFLKELKARLDRQPKLSRPQRSGFARGLIVGFLVAGVAFAVTSVSLTGLPNSTAQFFNAPVQFFSRIIAGHGSADQEVNHSQIKAVPLSPWFQTPVHTEPAVAPDVGQAFAISPAPDSSPAASTGGRAATSSTGAPSPASVLTQQELYPLAQASLGAGSRLLRVTPAKDVFESMCGGITASPPDVIETTRRITADPDCLHVSHARDVVELRVGYQAILLVRSKLYGPLSLSARDLYLALAARVPNPEQPDQLIDNPYTTWNQVDPALPYDSIHVYGPARSSTEGQLAAELLLDAGCNTFPALAGHATTCHRLRTDKAYEETAPGSFNYLDTLNRTPTALGITNLVGLRYLQGQLIANPIDGIVPDPAMLATQAYPAARTVYLYSSKGVLNSYRFWTTSSAIWALMHPSPMTDGRAAAAFWGFVPPAAAERLTSPEDLRTLKTVQFGY